MIVLIPFIIILILGIIGYILYDKEIVDNELFGGIASFMIIYSVVFFIFYFTSLFIN